MVIQETFENARVMAAEALAQARSGTEEALSKLKVTELKERLKERGLKVSGKKAELVERLLQHGEVSLKFFAVSSVVYINPMVFGFGDSIPGVCMLGLRQRVGRVDRKGLLYVRLLPAIHYVVIFTG